MVLSEFFIAGMGYFLETHYSSSYLFIESGIENAKDPENELSCSSHDIH